LDGLLSSRCRTASYIRFDFDLETKLGTEGFRNLDLPDFWILLAATIQGMVERVGIEPTTSSLQS
jgi:hypothetical protein